MTCFIWWDSLFVLPFCCLWLMLLQVVAVVLFQRIFFTVVSSPPPSCYKQTTTISESLCCQLPPWWLKESTGRHNKIVHVGAGYLIRSSSRRPEFNLTLTNYPSLQWLWAVSLSTCNCDLQLISVSECRCRVIYTHCLFSPPCHDWPCIQSCHGVN